MARTQTKAPHLSRRGFCAGVAAGVSGWAARPAPLAADEPQAAQHAAPSADYRIERGRIRHSVMGWCYNPIPTGDLIAACHRMGMTAMEGIGREFYPRLRELGMHVSLVGSHGFTRGPLDPENRTFCIDKLREGIDVAVEYGCANVITFTGMMVAGVSDQQAMRNCVECWQQVMPYAEEKGVNLCLEHLNTRDDTHPMKGHPGYFGNDVDLCIDLIKRVDSPRMKLLFDIYHVQVMNGDVIRRIRQYKDYIGHVHTAGVPGRNELDETQEINYPAVMRTLLDVGYAGFTAHEFIPTWPDKLAALRHGVRVCDV
jgi:hydroxypyruvate isomerase